MADEDTLSKKLKTKVKMLMSKENLHVLGGSHFEI